MHDCLSALAPQHNSDLASRSRALSGVLPADTEIDSTMAAETGDKAMTFLALCCSCLAPGAYLSNVFIVGKCVYIGCYWVMLNLQL